MVATYFQMQNQKPVRRNSNWALNHNQSHFIRRQPTYIFHLSFSDWNYSIFSVKFETCAQMHKSWHDVLLSTNDKNNSKAQKSEMAWNANWKIKSFRIFTWIARFQKLCTYNNIHFLSVLSSLWLLLRSQHHSYS